MSKVILTRQDDVSSDLWLQAVMADYAVPKPCHTFVGIGLADERVAFFIGEDGGGFGAIDSNPTGYVELSAAFASKDKARINAAISKHGGVEEYEFEPGTFKYDAKRIVTDAELTLFGGL